VLVFGEDENDTRAVKHLLEGLRPDGNWTVEARKRPPVLIRDAQPKDLSSRTERILAVVRAEEIDSDVIAVFAHEDCDAVEPAHVALESKIVSAFASTKYHVAAAVPAWEMESWLMQWPDAFPLHVPSWAPVDKTYRGRSVGTIVDSKEHLDRALRANGSTRKYRETDAPILTQIVAKRGWARDPRAKSDSYAAFVSSADRVPRG